MATIVVSDIVERSSVVNTIRGWEVDRVFHVQGLDGDTTKKLYDAANAPGVPRYNDPHPTVPDIRVQVIRAEPSGSFNAYVMIHYAKPESFRFGGAGPERAQIEVSASLVSIRASTTGGGDQVRIWTTVSGLPGSDPSAADVDAGRAVNGTVDVFKAEATFNYVRRESGDPADKALKYTGTVNSSEFRGKPAGSWLCTAITGRSNDGGVNYDVSYTFQYRRGEAPWYRGWQPVAVNYENGKIPKDAVPGPTPGMQHYALVDYYRAENFNTLGLT